MEIVENLIKIKENIPECVSLIAVSKTKPVDLIELAYEYGQRDFGENKVQELVEKHDSLPKDINWHMIGHLQRNKVKHIATFVHLIHSVDSYRLLLEINQAGLSWTTILNKQKNFRKAYSAFNIQKVANYNKKDIEKLLKNSGIIRNKLKVNAAIYNANKILVIQMEFGSFKLWLKKNNNLSLVKWVKLFKQTFKFTGPEITREFLISTGIVKGAHTINCPTFKNLIKA